MLGALRVVLQLLVAPAPATGLERPPVGVGQAAGGAVEVVGPLQLPAVGTGIGGAVVRQLQLHPAPGPGPPVPERQAVGVGEVLGRGGRAADGAGATTDDDVLGVLLAGPGERAADLDLDHVDRAARAGLQQTGLLTVLEEAGVTRVVVDQADDPAGGRAGRQAVGAGEDHLI